jgi:adenine-specific DNA methylase
VLRRAGFRRWADLYPPRQLAALLRSLDIAGSLDVSEAIRNRILLAIAGTGEMAGHLCRWDRFHPKTFEALANHRFSPLGLAVEQNPLAHRGRGTIPRRLEASLRASRWIQESVAEAIHRNGSDACRNTSKTDRATVTLGSSSTQPLHNDSVDLVVTDPPYYAAVQYGELSALFLAWLKTATGRQLPPDALSKEAVPSTVRNSGAEHYEKMLTDIFLETARTLSPEGKVLLTYHSTDFRGWAALGAALHASNLRIVALGIGHSENELDHPKRGRRAFTRDLVIECRKRIASDERPPVVVTKPRTSEARELLAAGYAIATSSVSKESMMRTFRALTSRLRSRLIYVPDLKQENS